VAKDPKTQSDLRQQDDEKAWKKYHDEIISESLVLSENGLPEQRKKLSNEALRKGFKYGFAVR